MAKNYTCSGCEIVVSAESYPAYWLRISCVENNGLRLYEKVSDVERYETFHIADQVIKNFCTGDCALNTFKKSFELFLREIKPITPPKNLRPLHY